VIYHDRTQAGKVSIILGKYCTAIRRLATLSSASSASSELWCQERRGEEGRGEERKDGMVEYQKEANRTPFWSQPASQPTDATRRNDGPESISN